VNEILIGERQSRTAVFALSNAVPLPRIWREFDAMAWFFGDEHSAVFDHEMGGQQVVHEVLLQDDLIFQFEEIPSDRWLRIERKSYTVGIGANTNPLGC